MRIFFSSASHSQNFILPSCVYDTIVLSCSEFFISRLLRCAIGKRLASTVLYGDVTILHPVSGRTNYSTPHDLMCHMTRSHHVFVLYKYFFNVHTSCYFNYSTPCHGLRHKYYSYHVFLFNYYYRAKLPYYFNYSTPWHGLRHKYFLLR